MKLSYNRTGNWHACPTTVQSGPVMSSYSRVPCLQVGSKMLMPSFGRCSKLYADFKMAGQIVGSAINLARNADTIE